MDLYLGTQNNRTFALGELLGVWLGIGRALGSNLSCDSSDQLSKWDWLDGETLEAARVLHETIAACRGLYNAKRFSDCAIGNHSRAMEKTAAAKESEAA